MSTAPPVTDRSVPVGLPDTVYRAARLVAHAINRGYWRVEVQGAEQVPARGPVILAPVHRSFMDFFVSSEATRRKLFFMAKDELWHSPALARLLEALGAFPVHREGTDRLAVGRAQSVLDQGEVLILFPEGTRRSGPVVEDLHDGAAFLSARSGAPIVPLGIAGTDRAMPKGSKFVRPVKVHVVVGAPLVPPARSAKGRVPRHQVTEMTRALAVALQAAYDEAQARAAAARH